MFIAIFIIAVVVSMPIVAVVLVTVASKREDLAWSLSKPAKGPVQAAARRIVDFQTDCPAQWARPVTTSQVKSRSAKPIAVGSTYRPADADSPEAGVGAENEDPPGRVTA